VSGNAGRPWPGGPDGPGDADGAAPDAQRILDLTLDADSLYRLRATVVAHAVSAGLPQRRADDMVIAVHELAANVIKHAGGHGKLAMWTQDQSVYCQVTDQGPAQAGAAAGAARAPVPPWPIEAGHGLWLVRQLADQMSLRAGQAGSQATVRFALRTAAPPSFRLSSHLRRGCTILAIAGPLDWTSSGQVADAVDDLIAADPALRLVIDVGGVTACDAFGLAALLRVRESISVHPAAELILADLPGPLARNLDEADLAGRFAVADSAETAVRRLG